MDDLMFLEQLGEEGASNATLNVVVANGQVCHVSDKICPFRFLDTCPLLYHAFEYGNETRLHASIAAPSRSAVVSLLRYCYTGNYLSSEAEYEPVTLLQHVEVYKMAADLDVPELQLLAHANFSCQIEFCCCLPTPPQDLRETIEFVYQNYADRASRQQSDIVATLLNYCISNFLYHKLGDNLEFLNLVSTTPAFHQDLCRTNMERNFEDDCAFDIIRLALDSLYIHSGPRPTNLASRDLPEEMLLDAPPEPSKAMLSSSVYSGVTIKQEVQDDLSSIKDETINTYDPSSSANTLVHRPKIPPQFSSTDAETDSSSDEDGFAMVHPLKSQDYDDTNDVMSSPEVVPWSPIDLLVATGGDTYPSDDEWTML